MLEISAEKGFKTELQAPTSVLVTRRVTFAAAHVLRRPEWDDRRNKEVFGQCAGDHGHNYVLEVSVSGEPDPATGMVVNLKDLDRAVKQAIVRQVDRRPLRARILAPAPRADGQRSPAANPPRGVREQLGRGDAVSVAPKFQDELSS